MPTRDTLVFIYGTLRKGYWNHVYVENADALGFAKTIESDFIMRAHSYPFVCRAKADNKQIATKITGELYAVSDYELKKLDVLEGYPRFYDREQILITTNAGENYTAWMYINNNGSGDVVESGDYSDHTAPGL